MESASSGFKRLILWQKAQAFASNVATMVSALPSDRNASIIGSQLLRSAGSIAANIAEGYGRYSQPAYRNYLSIARGSAFESESWLDLLRRQGYLSPDKEAQLAGQCEEVGRMLTARMKSLTEAKKSYALREEEAEYQV